MAMSEITEHTPGTFCWHDAATTDVPAAKGFYGELFGWSFMDMPMGNGQDYSMAQLRGKDVGAVCPQQPDMAAQGVPPHWTAYIAVARVDDTAAKVEGLGGKVLAGPFDVMDVGRMAMVQDPTGAVVALWEPMKHIGASVVGEPGAVAWNELMTTDPAKAAAFYTGLLGWSTKSSQIPGIEYTEFFVGERAAGGMMKIAPEMGPIPPIWLVYFMVEDCDASAERAQRMGAKVLAPPMDIPSVGRIASLQDPQGAVFALFQLPRTGG
jgi:predicted enzyme related to lactoylglutathione lyase